LAYVSPSRRAEFAHAVNRLGAVWLSQEGPTVLSGLPGFPRELPTPATADPFLLTRGGRDPLAYADAHGAWIHWLA
jgi:hypothetical protein